jgi:KDO2-lipid IV(A) lauroyltransferase
MRARLEYASLWLLLKLLGVLPRPAARALAAVMTQCLLLLMSRRRRTADFNLRLAFPDWTEAQRRAVIRGMARHLGWMAAEFAQFPRWKRETVGRRVVLDGQENFLAGRSRSKGVVFLTGHIGAWELSSFAHALYGFPLHYVARPVDNPHVDALINRYRCLSGNRPIFKNESARVMLKVLHEAGTVGILADQNTAPEEGVFVHFFGQQACATTGIARVALHSGAAVVPVYCYWDAAMRKYRLRFEPPLELVHGGDAASDILENTQRFANVLEEMIRKHPDQWIWVHARWKTRPKGEPPLYSF